MNDSDRIDEDIAHGNTETTSDNNAEAIANNSNQSDKGAELNDGSNESADGGGYVSPFESSLSTVLNSNFRDFHFICEVEERRLHLNGEIQAIYESEGYYPNGPITAGEIAEFIIEINACDKGLKEEERDPIWLYIDCVGGEMTEGFRLISAIELSKTPVYTVNMGQCSSMAFLIGIAGKKRFALPYSMFLMHDGYMYASGSTDKVIDQVKFEQRKMRKLIKPFVLSHSKMREKKYNKIEGRDFCMTAEDALKYGFIDEIVRDIDTLR